MERNATPPEARDKMLLTAHELAQDLHIKPVTLYAWAAQGRIPSIKIHGLVRFQKEEVEHWLEGFRKQPHPRRPSRVRRPPIDLQQVIARVKRDAYNPRHGETKLRSSPIGKEETDGAV